MAIVLHILAGRMVDSVDRYRTGCWAYHSKRMLLLVTPAMSIEVLQPLGSIVGVANNVCECQAAISSAYVIDALRRVVGDKEREKCAMNKSVYRFGSHCHDYISDLAKPVLYKRSTMFKTIARKNMVLPCFTSCA